MHGQQNVKKRTDEQTDLTKLIFTVGNFSKAPKNCGLLLQSDNMTGASFMNSGYYVCRSSAHCGKTRSLTLRFQLTLRATHGTLCLKLIIRCYITTF